MPFSLICVTSKWQNSGNYLPPAMTATSPPKTRQARQAFGTNREMLALPVPDETAVDYPHATQHGLFVRVSPKDRDGRIRRAYWHRWKLQVPDGTGGFRVDTGRESLGLAAEFEKGDSVLSIENAVLKVATARREKREAKSEGGSLPRLTVGQAWAFYATEKQLNREATHTKDQGVYNRYYAWFEQKLLDDLPYGWWSQFVTKLKAGKLVASLADGATEPTLGPLADASRIGIINLGIALYEIGHKHKGLKGFEKTENPAREAKKLIGTPNKRKSHITLAKLARAWNAADQLCSPWWRDQFYIYLLTGLRHSLVAHMQFSEIDWKDGAYVFSPHKRGTKRRGKKLAGNAADIRLPLSAKVMTILAARRRFATDKEGPVWYSPKPTRGKKSPAKAKGTAILSDPRASWSLIEAEIDLHFTPQDLRRTYATLGAATRDADLFAISLLMLHSSSTLATAAGIPDITVDYMQTEEAQERMRGAAEAISARIAGILALPEDEAAALAEPALPDELEFATYEGGEDSSDYEM